MKGKATSYYELDRVQARQGYQMQGYQMHGGSATKCTHAGNATECRATDCRATDCMLDQRPSPSQHLHAYRQDMMHSIHAQKRQDESRSRAQQGPRFGPYEGPGIPKMSWAQGGMLDAPICRLPHGDQAEKDPLAAAKILATWSEHLPQLLSSSTCDGPLESSDCLRDNQPGYPGTAWEGYYLGTITSMNYSLLSKFPFWDGSGCLFDKTRWGTTKKKNSTKHLCNGHSGIQTHTTPREQRWH
ncbi:hypothetical protein FB451DRAFT_1167160 [Mycena latifolia]|nr:hypothetical protein FB451DRAFT_1167160 [Mycena latifolia]